MEKSCYLKHIQVNSNDDNLQILGQVSVNYRTNGSGYIKIYASEAGKCLVTVVGQTIASVTGDATLVDSTHVMLGTNPETSGFTLTGISSSTIVKLIIDGKYFLGNINSYGFDNRLSDLNWLIGLKTLVVNNLADGYAYENDIKSLSRLVNLESFNLNVLNRDLLSGNIKDLGSLVKLTEIIIMNTNVQGEVESFVAMQTVNGRDECTGISIHTRLGRYVTFKDEIISGGDDKTLYWVKSGDNTVITIGSDSTTIHVNSNGSWTRVS